MWFKVDDNLVTHPKFIGLSDAAMALWVRAGAWAGGQETGGVIPKHVLGPVLRATPKTARELVTRRLWEPHPDGWVFHDWAVYQPTREALEDRRRKRSEAGRKGGKASGVTRRSKAEANASPPLQPVRTETNPDPTRPDPTRGGGAGEREGQPPVVAQTRPPPRCPKHITTPATGPCGPCGDYRRAHDAWTAPPRPEVRCPEHGTLHHGTCSGCVADEKAGAR